MIETRRRRRGYVMVLVLAVMSLVAGVLTVLAFSGAAYYRNHQAERVRLVARAVCDSGAELARARSREFLAAPPAEPVPVDVSALLAPGTSGSATLFFPSAGDRRTCRVHVRIERGRYEACSEIDLDLAGPPEKSQAAGPRTDGGPPALDSRPASR